MASHASRQNFPHTLRTNHLTSNSDYPHKDLELYTDSDSSSICHSPCWDDISGKKSKKEKRRKKQQERELEKAREKQPGFSLKASELASVKARPKKLNKLPPNVKASSAKSGLEHKHDGSHVNPFNQHGISTELPVSKAKASNRGVDINVGSLLACKAPFAATTSHHTNCHPNTEFVGGLKLRRAEEENIQEAIRQVKVKDRNENRYSSREAVHSRKGDPSTVDSMRQHHDNWTEWSSNCKEQPLHQEFNKSSSFKVHGEAEDFFTISRHTKKHRESPTSQDSSDRGRLKDKMRDNKFERLPRDSRPDRSCSQSSQTINNKIPNPQKPDTLDDLSNVGVAISCPEINEAESFKKETVLQRSKRPRGSKLPASLVAGALGHITKQSDQIKHKTILASNSAPLGYESGDAHDKLLPNHGLKDVTSIPCTDSFLHSTHLSPDCMSNYSDSSHNLASTKHRSWSGQATPDWGSNIGLAPSMMEINQEPKNYFDSNDDTHQRNPRSRFSHAVSTDSSEEYSTQDDLSNITTPTESRPHSSKDKNPREYQNEAWSEQMVARLELQVESEQDVLNMQSVEFKMDGKDHISKSPINTTDQPNNVSRDSRVLPLNILKEQTQKSNTSSSQTKELSHFETEIQQNLPQPSEEVRPWGPLRGLIKKPQKLNKPLNSSNHNINSDVKNYSQYLQEARSRIGTNALSSRAGRPNPNFLVAQTTAEPFAKMFVVCCSCKYYHDLPSKLYACMAKPDDLVAEEKLGVSGVITTTVKCPWCGHGMSTSCCAGYATVVYLKERLH